MKLAVLAVVLVVVALTEASHPHHPHLLHHPHHHHHPHECYKNGQFLPNGYDECSYIRCDYGDEPWYDEHGNIKFVPVVMKCPYGTSIDLYKDFSCHPHEHAHHHHGYQPHYHCPGPCSVLSDKCPAPPAPKYQPHHYEPVHHHH